MRTPPKSLLSLLALLFGLFAAIPMAGAQSAQSAAKKGAGFVVPVTGGSAAGTFDGTFTIDRFVATADNNTAAAVGVLKGTVTNAATGAKSTVVKNIAWPVATGEAARSATPTKFVPTNAPTNFIRTADGSAAAADGMVKVQASCDILNLVLGPLHLDLLGLVIDLNRVILNITGQTGAGNLLGNLLCGITGILDGVGIGAQLAQLLNQLLSILS